MPQSFPHACPCVRNPPCAYVGLSWLSLVGLRPSCLDGCLSRLAQAHFSGDSCVHLVAATVLHFFPSCFGTHLGIKPSAFVVIPVPSFPHTEQLLLIVMHESPRSISHTALALLMDNPACLLCVFDFPLPFPHVPVRSPSSIVSFALIRACRCVPAHLFSQSCSNSSRVGNRSLAHVDETWSSLVARGRSEHAQIRLTSARATCASYSSRTVLVLVRPDDDVWPTGSDDVSHFVSRCLRAEVTVCHIERSCRRD